MSGDFENALAIGHPQEARSYMHTNEPCRKEKIAIDMKIARQMFIGDQNHDRMTPAPAGFFGPEAIERIGARPPRPL